MEEIIFASKKGNKLNIVKEEISYDLGKTWTPTGKTKKDEENIVYDSCDCSETYEWLESGEIVVNCESHKSSTLNYKYGCEEYKRTDFVKVGELIELVDGCSQKVFHKTETNGSGVGDDYIWFNDKWIKISCDN